MQDLSTDPPPIRLMTRLMAHLQTAILARWIAMLDGDLDRAVIYSLIAHQTYPFDQAAGQSLRSIPVFSIAESLSRPYETVRRHVNALVEARLCVRDDQGVRAAGDALQLPAMRAFLDHLHDCVVRFLEDMRRFGMPMPEVRPSGEYRAAATIQTGINLLLGVTDSNRDVHDNWLELVIFSSVYCANSRLLLAEPRLARQYAHALPVPPPHLRPPVRTTAVARMLSLPEATVRRRMKQLIVDGRIERLRGGVRVSEDWLNRPESIATSLNSFGIIRLLIARLGANGFPLANPASAYRQGRPADLNFE